jgi:hypothetical protein
MPCIYILQTSSLPHNSTTYLHTASMISTAYQSSTHIQMSSFTTSPPPYHPSHHSSPPPSPAPPYGAPTTKLRSLPPAYISNTSPLPRPVTSLPPTTSFLPNMRRSWVPHFPRFRAPRFPGIRLPHAPRRNVGCDFYIAAQTRDLDPRERARSRACTIVIFFSGLLICLILLVVITQLEEATTGRS